MLFDTRYLSISRQSTVCHLQSGGESRSPRRLGLLALLVHVCQVALAAVLAVEVLGHEDAGTARLVGALTTHALHLVGAVDLVVLEHMKLDLLLGVLHLLGLGVGLLLTLLASTTKAQDKVKGGLLLDVVVLKGAAILQLLAGKDEALLIRGDALLVLDLGLDSLDSVGTLNLKGDSLPCECLHKDLHA